jgi:hypothetical protein
MPYNNDPTPDAEADEIVRREAARHGMSETMYRMLRVAGTKEVQDLVHDLRSGPAQPSSIAAPPTERSAPHRGSGWVDAKPLGKQPGIDLIDQMVENDTLKQRLQARDERVRAALSEMEYQERIKKQQKLNKDD